MFSIQIRDLLLQLDYALFLGLILDQPKQLGALEVVLLAHRSHMAVERAGVRGEELEVIWEGSVEERERRRGRGGGEEARGARSMERAKSTQQH